MSRIRLRDVACYLIMTLLSTNPKAICNCIFHYTFKLSNRRFFFYSLGYYKQSKYKWQSGIQIYWLRYFITALFHIGQLLQGGGFDYFTDLTSGEYGTLAKHIPCQHGHLTNGQFDKIINSGEAWEGWHGCINFYLKKKCFNIFCDTVWKIIPSMNAIIIFLDLFSCWYSQID